MTRYLPLECPPNIPEESICRKLDIPASQEWLAVVNSALLEMIRPEAWQQVNETDITPEEAAARCYQMYELYLVSGSTGECAVSCETLLYCINNDAETRAAILAALLVGTPDHSAEGDRYAVTNIINTAYPTPEPACDDSDKYGLAWAVVDTLNTICMDLLDVAALAADNAELIKSLFSWVPVLGRFWEAAVDFATGLADWAIDTYPAAYTTQAHQDIACAFFCEMTACELTVDQMRTAFRKLLSTYVPPGAFASIEETMAWFAAVALSGDTMISAALQWMLLEIWSRGSTWLGVSPNILFITASTSIPIDPAELCDVCPSCVQWLGGEDNQADWPIQEYYGVYGTYNAANDRFEATWNGQSGSGKFVQVKRTAESAEHLTEMYISWDCAHTRGAAGVMQVVADGVTLYSNTDYPPNGTGVLHLELDGTARTVVTITLGCRTWGDDEAAHAYITSIILCQGT